jgi:hypothetical protein
MADAAAVVAAQTALAGLVSVDLDGLTPAELNEIVLSFQQLRGTLEATEAHVLQRWDAMRAWEPEGAKSAAAWLAWKQHIPITVARQRLRHARALRTLPDVADAWAAGEIDRAHLVTLLGVQTARTRAAFETDHKVLLDSARTKGFIDFKRDCDLWEAFADPDGAEQGADTDRAARELHLSQSFAGMWFGRTTLDPVSGEIVHGTLSAIEHELFETDWAQAKERLGREPLAMELQRTPAQRRADALVEMATRARTAPVGGRRPAPLFTVVVGLETLTGPVLELYNRTVLTPGTAAAWLTQADVERVVFESPSRVIDVGAQRRFFRGALRRAIEVRDRTCFHPSCDEVPLRPQIDHIIEHARGGPTTEHNGRLGCAHHNQARNHHPDDWDDDAHSTPTDPDTGPDPPGDA